MAYSYGNKFQHLDLVNYKQFMVSRFSRFYPMHVLVFLISIYIMYLINFETNWKYAIMNLFLIQTYANTGVQVFSFSSISWFVADCVFLYALTPFFLLFLNKTKIFDNFKLLLLLEVVVIGCGFVVGFFLKSDLAAYSTEWWFIYISPYNRLFDYLSGLLGGAIFLLLVQSKQNKYVFLKFSTLEMGVILIGYLNYKSPLFAINSLRMDIFFVPILLLTIFIFAFQSGFLSKILSLRLVVRLGKLSFSIFMIHQTCITLAAFVLGSNIYGAGGKKHFLGQMLLFGAIICIADVINRYYEIPLRNWIKSYSAKIIYMPKRN